MHALVDYTKVIAIPDDLESFFWLFAYIMLSMQKPKKAWHRNSAILAKWASKDNKVAYDAKTEFLSNPIPEGCLRPLAGG